MNKNDVKELQRTLNDAGYGPIDVDGIYGKKTAAAYQDMLRDSNAAGEGSELPVPPAAKPWWASRAVLGSVAVIITGLAGVAGWSLDATQTTDLIYAIVTVVFGAISWWGSVKRKGEIDPTLVLPNMRFHPVRMRGDGLPTNSSPASYTGFFDGASEHGPFFSDT